MRKDVDSVFSIARSAADPNFQRDELARHAEKSGKDVLDSLRENGVDVSGIEPVDLFDLTADGKLGKDVIYDLQLGAGAMSCVRAAESRIEVLKKQIEKERKLGHDVAGLENNWLRRAEDALETEREYFKSKVLRARQAVEVVRSLLRG